MREIIIIILTISILSFISGMQAQTVGPESIIEKTSHIYEEWGGMEVKFSIHITSTRNNLTENFEGTLQMKNNKFVLTTPDMVVWFNGITQWTLLPQNQEVNISNPEGDDLRMLNPMLLFQNYKNDFNVALSGESTSMNAKAAFDIMLTPRKTESIEQIEVQIEKNTSLPARLVVTMRNQIRHIITVQELKKKVFTDEMFTFPKTTYPDVEIIDLR